MKTFFRQFQLTPKRAYLLMALLCWLPTWIVVWADKQASESLFLASALLVLAALCIGVLGSIGGRKAPLLGAVWLLFLPAEIASYVLAGEPVSFGLVQATFQTNSGEVMELFGMYIVIASITILYWGMYYWAWLVWRKHPVVLKSSLRKWIVAAFFLFVGGISLQMFQISSKNDSWIERLDFTITCTASKFCRVYPIDVLYNTGRYIAVRQEEEMYTRQIGEGRFQIISSPILDKKPVSEYPIVVFVIGETGNVAHWQLYGYRRATTPHLMQRERIIAFTDVLSPATLTSISVPMMVSRSTPKDPKRWQYEGSLIHCFNKADFLTAWLGNQASTFSIVRASSNKMDFYFNTGKEVNSLNTYDEILLPHLDTYLDSVVERKKPACIVLHTMGSHFRYDARYPEEFDRFTPTTRAYKTTNSVLHESNRTALINSYDNSVLYTDFFLEQIAQRIDSLQRPALFLYAPDHGEGLGELDPRNILHGSEHPLRDELEIPLIIGYNKAYEKHNSTLINTLMEKRHTPISSTEIPALLVRLSGITSPEFPVSLADPAFRPQKRYYLSPNLKVRSADEIHCTKE